MSLAELHTRADAGDADALNALGNAYANGSGVAQDFAAAVRYYTEAALHGHAPAEYNLGMLAELGRGMAPDAGTAYRFYLKAAQQGFAPAQFSVGNMCATGEGTAQDFSEAAKWFRQAAEKGIVEAQYNLGLACELGRGVPKDEAEAQKWYREAGNHGYARAQYNLALMLDEGRGSAADPAAAAENYRAAAEQGFALAQNNYGILRAEGRPNLPADLVEGYAWLALAAENGAKPAGRDILAKKLTPAQLSAATDRLTTLRSQLSVHSASAPKSSIASGPAAAPGNESGELASRLKSSEAALAALKVEHARVADSARALETEKKALQQKLADRAKAAAPDSNLATGAEKLAVENTDLMAHETSAKRQIAELQTALAEARASQKKQLSTGTEGVNQQLPVAQKNTVEQEKARATANEKLAELRAELANAKAAARVLQQTNAELERASGGARTVELGNARAELAALQRTQEADRETLTKLNAQLDGAGKTIEDLRGKNESLLKELDVSKKSAAAALAAQTDVAKSAPDNDASKLELQTLQSRVHALESQVEEERANAAREITTLAAQLQQSREANRALMEANSALVGSKQAGDSAVNEQLTGRVQALTEENEKLRKEQQRLTSDAARLTEEKKAAEETAAAARRTPEAPAGWSKEKASLEAQVAQMTQQVDRAQFEIAELKTRVTSSDQSAKETAATVDQLKTANQKLETDAKGLNEQIATLRANSGHRAEIEQARAAAEQKAAAVATQLASAQRDIANLHAENERLSENVQAVNRDRGTRIAQLQQENAAVSARLRQAQGTLDQIAAAARIINGASGSPPAVGQPSRSAAPSVSVPAAVAQTARFHTVAEGDSLSRISVRYYGTTNRWKEIYDANRELLRRENALRPGQRLRIP